MKEVKPKLNDAASSIFLPIWETTLDIVNLLCCCRWRRRSAVVYDPTFDDSIWGQIYNPSQSTSSQDNDFFDSMEN